MLLLLLFPRRTSNVPEQIDTNVSKDSCQPQYVVEMFEEDIPLAAEGSAFDEEFQIEDTQEKHPETSKI